MNQELPLVPLRRIEQAILVIRGHRVMLSTDLAALYDVEPKVLVQAVKRNIERFPDDEYRILKSRFVTSSWRVSAGLRSQSVTLKRGEHAKYPPYAFTAMTLGRPQAAHRAWRCCRACCAASGQSGSTSR